MKSKDPSNPSFGPSIFPTGHVKSASPGDLARYSRVKKRQSAPAIASTSSTTPPNQKATLQMDYGTQVNFPDPLESTVPFLFECDFVSGTEKSTSVSKCQKISSKRNAKVQTETKETKSTESNTDIVENTQSCSLPFYQFNDRQFRSFCGVSKEFYRFLVFKVSPGLKESKYVSKETKILLLLVKFKLNVAFSILGSFFDISDKTARLLFYRVLNVVYEICKNYVIWLDKPTIKARMPPAFKALYPETRVIIDASEIECERPPTVKQRVLMYSNYKSRFTAKFLVGIAPSGEITFVSKSYGGRTTDTEITVKSGFLNLIEQGDIVMADKGFPHIETDLNSAGAILVMPPFKRNNFQFSQKQNKDGYECASVRIHVERAIARMKIFEILNFMPNHLLPHLDKVLMIVSFFCNCFPDLIQS